jgi:hypothetical protein
MANNLSGFSMKDQVTAALRVLIQTEHIHNYLLQPTRPT